MSLPVDETLIDTFPNTMAWRYKADGAGYNPVTPKEGADLCVHFIKSSTKLLLHMKEGDRIYDLVVLNTLVPFNNVILPAGNKSNRYVFKDWSPTEQGREPGKRSMIMIQFDSFKKSFRFISYFLLAANQDADTIRALFPPPPLRTPLRVQQSSQQQRRFQQEDEEEEVVEVVAEDDNKSVDLLGGDDTTTDDDEDTLGTLNDNNEAEDDDDESNGHLGFADCSQQHVFIGVSNLQL